MQSKLHDQYLSDYHEKNDKQNPFSVNDTLHIETSNTGPPLLHTCTLVHCINITVNYYYCFALGQIQGKFTCN